MRTKYRSLTTDGAGIVSRSEWNTTPLETRTSAFSLRTRTTARVAGTTARGCSVTLSTKARGIAGGPEYSNRFFAPSGECPGRHERPDVLARAESRVCNRRRGQRGGLARGMKDAWMRTTGRAGRSEV